MPFYEAHTYQWHIGFARLFKTSETLFGKNWATARKLETNAYTNFLMAENMAYQCMEDGRWNMPTLRLSWLTVRFRHNVETESEI